MQEPMNSHQPQEFRPCRKFFFPLAFVAIALIFVTSVFVFDIRMPGARLQDAAEKGNVEEVRRLLAKGVDVNWQNTYGTALHRAATMGHLPVARLLLESGAVFFKAYREAIFIPENIEQAFGVTPLHLAVHKNRKEMVEFLISKGADVDAMFTLGRDWSSKFVRTTIQIAGSQTNTEMVILLQKATRRDGNEDNSETCENGRDVPSLQQRGMRGRLRYRDSRATIPYGLQRFFAALRMTAGKESDDSASRSYRKSFE